MAQRTRPFKFGVLRVLDLSLNFEVSNLFKNPEGIRVNSCGQGFATPTEDRRKDPGFRYPWASQSLARGY